MAMGVTPETTLRAAGSTFGPPRRCYALGLSCRNPGTPSWPGEPADMPGADEIAAELRRRVG
jgi:hypothetical protein